MKVLVTGIKPYTTRLYCYTPGSMSSHFDAFAPVHTKKQVFDATHFNGNTGNYFIGEAAVEAVGRNNATFLDFGHLWKKTQEAEFLEDLRSRFDAVVFVTANLLRSDYNAKAEGELLSRINLPVIVLGIGCQRLRDLAGKIPDGTLQFLAAIKSLDHHIFTRGTPSAEYLTSQGLSNVWPTGCPSLFFRPQNVLASLRALKVLDWSAKLRIAFSGYLGDITSVRDIKVFTDRQPGSSYILQDEHLSSSLVFDAGDDADVYNDLSGELSAFRPYIGSTDIKDVRFRIFFDTNLWRGVVGMHDASFGRRFHGVVAALQSGIPGLMIANDDRMREMLLQFGLPYIDVTAWNSVHHNQASKMKLIKDTVSDFDLERWTDQYLHSEEVFRKRMSSLGLGSPLERVDRPEPPLTELDALPGV